MTLNRAALIAAMMLAGWPALAASVAVTIADAAGKPLPDAVVYVTPVAGKAPQRAASALIDQIGREFVPLVSVMQTGAMVSFPNKDNIRHQVYSFSPAKTFELRLYSGTPASPVLFDKPGLVTLGCNIHDSMIAYALVVDTPWFAKTDLAGKAVIDGFPPGDYDIQAWHHRQSAAAVSSQRLTAKSAVSDLAIRIDVKPGR